VAALDRVRRTVPAHQALRPDPALLASITDEHLAESFAPMAVVQTATTLDRFRAEIQPGLDAADLAAMDRIQRNWHLRLDPDQAQPFERPTLVLTGRQDSSVGYRDQLALLDLYPRATFAILDVAGHNLQIEQPALFEALVNEWLDRVAAEPHQHGIHLRPR